MKNSDEALAKQINKENKMYSYISLATSFIILVMILSNIVFYSYINNMIKSISDDYIRAGLFLRHLHEIKDFILFFNPLLAGVGIGKMFPILENYIAKKIVLEGMKSDKKNV